MKFISATIDHHSLDEFVILREGVTGGIPIKWIKRKEHTKSMLEPLGSMYVWKSESKAGVSEMGVYHVSARII